MCTHFLPSNQFDREILILTCDQLTVVCTACGERRSYKQYFKVKISLYYSDCAETEQKASIIGDKLQLRLYITPMISISFEASMRAKHFCVLTKTESRAKIKH